jgi:hypothetical protein
MSVINVGKAGCPLRENTIVPNAAENVIIFVGVCLTAGAVSLSCNTCIRIKIQAIPVDNVAPTPIGLKI